MEYQITDETFEKAISEGTVLVDFWADWCGPCKMQAPILEQISEELPETEIKVCKLDVDQNRLIPTKFEIRGIPTMILFKGGKEFKRLVGLHSKAQIVALLG